MIFVMIGGLKNIFSLMLDNRRTFVVILPILFGMSTPVCSYIYADLPDWAALFFMSPLTLGTLTVLILGMLFRIGVPLKKSSCPKERGDVQAFVLECSKMWTLNKVQATTIANEVEAKFWDNEDRCVGKEVTLKISRYRTELSVICMYDDGNNFEKKYSLGTQFAM